MTKSRRVLVAGLGVVAVTLMAVAGLLLGRHQATLHSPLQPAVSSPATTDTPTSAPMDDGSPSSLPSVSEPQGERADRSPDSDTDEAKRLWEQTIEGFAKRFTVTSGGQKAWLARLRPYVTEDVLNSLATVDVNDVPNGHFGGFEILQDGEMQWTARIVYNEGWSMVIYLISDGAHSRVFRYDRFEE